MGKRMPQRKTYSGFVPSMRWRKIDLLFEFLRIGIRPVRSRDFTIILWIKIFFSFGLFACQNFIFLQYAVHKLTPLNEYENVFSNSSFKLHHQQQQHQLQKHSKNQFTFDFVSLQIYIYEFTWYTAMNPSGMKSLFNFLFTITDGSNHQKSVIFLKMNAIVTYIRLSKYSENVCSSIWHLIVTGSQMH